VTLSHIPPDDEEDLSSLDGSRETGALAVHEGSFEWVGTELLLNNAPYPRLFRVNVVISKEHTIITNLQFFLTSKSSVEGESILLCQKKNRLKERAKMNAKASLRPLKQESLCVRKWNTSEKANMAHARRSRQSPLACPKRGGPE
jgi:hypothetical protein